MSPSRCPECYRRLTVSQAVHDAVCPAKHAAPPAARGEPRSRSQARSAGGPPPSRASRLTWAEYLATRPRKSPEEQRAAAAERQRRHRERLRSRDTGPEP